MRKKSQYHTTILFLHAFTIVNTVFVRTPSTRCTLQASGGVRTWLSCCWTTGQRSTAALGWGSFISSFSFFFLWVEWAFGLLVALAKYQNACSCCGHFFCWYLCHICTILVNLFLVNAFLHILSGWLNGRFSNQHHATII